MMRMISIVICTWLADLVDELRLLLTKSTSFIRLERAGGESVAHAQIHGK